MLKQRRLIADQVAASLFEAEAAIDKALAKAAQLAGIMPGLREQAGLSALVGQQAVERAGEAYAALALARRAICETHKELSLAQQQIGLGAVMYGTVDKPPTMADPQNPPRLQAVRRAAI
ncbi:hypothetical protein [Phenylobacterium aquaticum]|uniref:hypothetical protein n=1 Tax=Phenylobacterium aquaticum TaxID=1763816 RepID=UPI0026EE8CC5|nr:hypothetical protein [Phenylobacterium aquaticum]